METRLSALKKFVGIDTSNLRLYHCSDCGVSLHHRVYWERGYCGFCLSDQVRISRKFSEVLA